MNNFVYATIKEVSFCTLLVQNIGRGRETFGHEFEPHFKMNNLVYATFKEVSFLYPFLPLMRFVCPEHYLYRTSDATEKTFGHEFEPH